MRLRPLAQQVVVVTGASSGIGRVTAREAARRGAAVLLAARNGHALDESVRAIRGEGGRAAAVVADVAVAEAVDRIAECAVAEFGRIDSWVNNAAVAVYGRLLDVPLEDARRQLDVNFWGTVYGSRAAAERMRAGGGAIINVASVLADRAVPLQGFYCASKHAVKAFTDTLRMEFEEASIPISVSLVKPSSVDTPFFEKARSYLGVEPRPIAPVYHPRLVADAILRCAERPTRDVVVGGAGRALGAAQTYAPRLVDRWLERRGFDAQRTDVPLAPGRRNNLYAPAEQDGGERGWYEGRVLRRSVYTRAALHPGAATATALAALGVGLAVAAGLRAWRDGDD